MTAAPFQGVDMATSNDPEAELKRAEALAWLVRDDRGQLLLRRWFYLAGIFNDGPSEFEFGRRSIMNELIDELTEENAAEVAAIFQQHWELENVRLTSDRIDGDDQGNDDFLDD